MTVQLQFRRGSASQNNTYIGAEGELTIDKDQWNLRLHDGVNPGGHIIGPGTGSGTVSRVGLDLTSLGFTQNQVEVTTNGTFVLSGTLNVAHGGTGVSTFGGVNTLLYTSSADNIRALANTPRSILTTNAAGTLVWTATGTANTVLRTDGTTLSFDKVKLDMDITGVLGITNGGTGLNTPPPAGQILIGTGTAYQLAHITAGDGVLIADGAGTITISTRFSGGSTGFSLAPNGGVTTLTGTLNVSNGGTGLNTIPAAGQILIGNGTGGFNLNQITVSGGLAITNNAGTINIDASSLNTSGYDYTPVGTIIAFGSTTPPTGYLECNGVAVSRNLYADLFRVIGISFGAGDGSNTFNIPDLRGQFLRGWDHGRALDPARAFGSSQTDGIKDHVHRPLTVSGYNDDSAAHAGGLSKAGTGYNDATAHSGPMYSTGSYPAASTETRPTNVAVTYCIKYASAANQGATSTVIIQNNTGPAFSVKPAANQTIANLTSTPVKIIFDSEEYDTNSTFANNRFQPGVAGYYLIEVSVKYAYNNFSATLGLFKNGVALRSFDFNTSYADPNITNRPAADATINTMVQMNGNSDYLEVFIANNTGYNISSPFVIQAGLTWWQGSMIRPV
jgi:Phage Tail Collar Domain/Major tropism determinant N-terminal domain